MKTVILTAGQGKRMLPLTHYIPKSMLPIGLKPSVIMTIEQAVEAGSLDVCLVVSPDSSLPDICEFYKNYCPLLSQAKIQFVVQQRPLGSGDALLQAENFCKKEKFFLANCDELFEKNAFAQLAQCGGLCVGAKKVTKKECKSYGVLVCDIEKIIAIEEKPQQVDVQPLVSVGRYLLDGRIFDCIRQSYFVGGEKRLTDALNLLCAKTYVQPCVLKGKRFDVGNPRGYKKAFCFFANEVDFSIK